MWYRQTTEHSQPQAHHPHQQVSCIPPQPYQGLDKGVSTVYNISQLVFWTKFHQPKLPQDRLIDLSISLISSLILGAILVTIIPPFTMPEALGKASARLTPGRVSRCFTPRGTLAGGRWFQPIRKILVHQFPHVYRDNK